MNYLNRLLPAFMLLCAAVSPLYAAEPKDATTDPALAINEVIEAEAEPIPVPAWSTRHRFADLGNPKDKLLLGIQNEHTLDFTLRRDRIVTDAQLIVKYTPSPALLPNLSHLRIYLNDVLMGTVAITEQQLGQQAQHELPLQAYLLSDFNRVRIEFVGHYTDICEDPGNSTLWVSIAHDSQIILQEQAVALTNDLAYFPLPFFDAREAGPTQVHMVFHQDPTAGEQQAAAILSSYFGSLAGWRGTRFPVLYDQLPAAGPKKELLTSTVVLATNDRRPDFLADTQRFPAVDAPVIQLIDHPEHPYSKVLLIFGRHEADLQAAAQVLAMGSPLLRGTQVSVDEVQALEPRQPYDAPNWIPTNRPVRFAELVEYPGQLQVRGLQPDPIQLSINLPPDLFVWRNQGIPLATRFRYTAPNVEDESRLSISLNDQFITSLPLSPKRQSNLEQLRLRINSSETANVRDRLLFPSLKLGAHNQLRYDFSFASKYGNAQPDFCQTALPIDVFGLIDEESTLDVSGYYHYLAMPDLWAFSNSGFPFSRLADLSETLVLMPASPSTTTLSTLLEALANISAHTGYPALAVRVSNDWADAKTTDADLLVIGALTEDLQPQSDLSLLLEQSRDRLLHNPAPVLAKSERYAQEQHPAHSRVALQASAPIAAITGLESPFFSARSLVALQAHDTADFELLRDTLASPEKMDAVRGSVAMLRDSGVNSQLVGEQYYVGHLPWWVKLWYFMSKHPIALAVMAVLASLMAAVVLWQVLRWVAKRRVAEG